ncbi:Ig-like domain-containing protein [Streptomyces sp. NPDC007904]|uniref:Ig-like domain-containing protein n=1 Tax=Streptomyces sp. NPDC007904 TaxID=3364787 RepID=UPI0036E40689
MCLLAGCNPEPAHDRDRTEGLPAAAGTAATPRIRLNAADGQKHVSVSRGGRVGVEAGRIAEVSLATAAGRAVPGALFSDGGNWAPKVPPNTAPPTG